MDSQSRGLPARTYLGLFLGQMLRRPAHTAALAPSSTDLAREMAMGVGPDSGTVIELGGGTGKITEAILARGVAPERLVVFETNPAFASLLRHRFAGVRVIERDAREIDALAPDGVGAVISGLPLVSIPTPVQHGIVAGAFARLRPGGLFVQFTYGWRPPVDRVVREALGLSWTVSRMVWRNLPPARVYRFSRAGQPG